MILPQSFYKQNTIKVARYLLGCFLVRKINGKLCKYKIVETESYCGPNDLASHASKGMTKRNEVMFGHPGFVYIYLIYGMYNMLNIVTEENNYPAAVLIRALEPLSLDNKKYNGPGKLTKNLKIDKSFNSKEIFKRSSGLWIEDKKNKILDNDIGKAPRIGVDYAGEYKDKEWRFYLKSSLFVSKKN